MSRVLTAMNNLFMFFYNVVFCLRKFAEPFTFLAGFRCALASFLAYLLVRRGLANRLPSEYTAKFAIPTSTPTVLPTTGSG